MWCVCGGGGINPAKNTGVLPVMSSINHSNEVQSFGELAESEQLQTDNQLFNEAMKNSFSCD